MFRSLYNTYHGSILDFVFPVEADDCVTRLSLAPVVTEVISSCEHGRLVNEKPTNETKIIRMIRKHKFINREWLISSSDCLSS